MNKNCDDRTHKTKITEEDNICDQIQDEKRNIDENIPAISDQIQLQSINIQTDNTSSNKTPSLQENINATVSEEVTAKTLEPVVDSKIINMFKNATYPNNNNSTVTNDNLDKVLVTNVNILDYNLIDLTQNPQDLKHRSDSTSLPAAKMLAVDSNTISTSVNSHESSIEVVDSLNIDLLSDTSNLQQTFPKDCTESEICTSSLKETNKPKLNLEVRLGREAAITVGKKHDSQSECSETKNISPLGTLYDMCESIGPDLKIMERRRQSPVEHSYLSFINKFRKETFDETVTANEESDLSEDEEANLVRPRASDKRTTLICGLLVDTNQTHTKPVKDDTNGIKQKINHAVPNWKGQTNSLYLQKKDLPGSSHLSSNSSDTFSELFLDYTKQPISIKPNTLNISSQVVGTANKNLALPRVTYVKQPMNLNTNSQTMATNNQNFPQAMYIRPAELNINNQGNVTSKPQNLNIPQTIGIRSPRLNRNNQERVTNKRKNLNLSKPIDIMSLGLYMNNQEKVTTKPQNLNLPQPIDIRSPGLNMNVQEKVTTKPKNLNLPQPINIRSLGLNMNNREEFTKPQNLDLSKPIDIRSLGLNMNDQENVTAPQNLYLPRAIDIMPPGLNNDTQEKVILTQNLYLPEPIHFKPSTLCTSNPTTTLSQSANPNQQTIVHVDKLSDVQITIPRSINPRQQTTVHTEKHKESPPIIIAQSINSMEQSTVYIDKHLVPATTPSQSQNSKKQTIVHADKYPNSVKCLEYIRQNESDLRRNMIVQNCEVTVDKIIEKQKVNDEVYYKVKWNSYSWEREEEIIKSELKDVLNIYLASQSDSSLLRGQTDVKDLSEMVKIHSSLDVKCTESNSLSVRNQKNLESSHSKVDLTSIKENLPLFELIDDEGYKHRIFEDTALSVMKLNKNISQDIVTNGTSDKMTDNSKEVDCQCIESFDQDITQDNTLNISPETEPVLKKKRRKTSFINKEDFVDQPANYIQNQRPNYCSRKEITPQNVGEIERKTNCQHCKLKFTSYDLSKHNKIYAKLLCPQCGYRICDEKKLLKHICGHARTLHQCPLCCKVFKDQNLYVAHKHNDHHGKIISKKNEPNTWKCTQCTKGFKKKIVWMKHIAKHCNEEKNRENRNTCRVCQKGFLTPQKLELHTSLHQVSYQECEQCKECFDVEEDTSEHTCTGIPSIKYISKFQEVSRKICNAKQSKLSKHYQQIKKKTYSEQKKKNNSCISCIKGFKTRDSFYEHVNVKECPNLKDNGQCMICKQFFQSLDNLKAHVTSCFRDSLSSLLRPKSRSDDDSSYNNEQMKRIIYHCRKCNTLLPSLNVLQNHNNVLHPRSEKYQCFECGFTCSGKALLKKHLKNKQCSKLSFYPCFLCEQNGIHYAPFSSILMLIAHLKSHRKPTIQRTIYIPQIKQLTQSKKMKSVPPVNILNDKSMLLSLPLKEARPLCGKPALSDIPGFGSYLVNLNGTAPNELFTAEKFQISEMESDRVAQQQQDLKVQNNLSSTGVVKIGVSHLHQVLKVQSNISPNEVAKNSVPRLLQNLKVQSNISPNEVAKISVSHPHQDSKVRSKLSPNEVAKKSVSQRQQDLKVHSKLSPNEVVKKSVSQRQQDLKVHSNLLSTGVAKLRVFQPHQNFEVQSNLPSNGVGLSLEPIKSPCLLCFDCLHPCQSERHVIKHFRTVHQWTSIELVVCKKCNLAFRDEPSLNTHLIKGKTPSSQASVANNDAAMKDLQVLPCVYVCSSCHTPFCNRNDFEEHKKQHTLCTKPHCNLKTVFIDWPCYICNKKIQATELLSNHIKSHETIIYECYCCSVETSNKDELVHHLLTIHNRKWGADDDVWLESISPFKKILYNIYKNVKREASLTANIKSATFYCSKCKALFFNLVTLSRHRTVCHKKFKDTKLKEPSHEQTSIRTKSNSDTNDQSNDTVNKAIISAKEMIDKSIKSKFPIKHMVNLPVKNIFYNCLYCQNCVFDNWEKLKEHIISEHCTRHFETLPLKKELCEMKITSEQFVKYRCHLCDKLFLDRQSAWIHAFEHVGRRVEQCHICRESFVSTTALRFHLNYVHNALFCLLCYRTFHSFPDLNTHLQLHVLEVNIPRDENKKMIIEIETNPNWMDLKQYLLPNDQSGLKFAITSKISAKIFEDSRLFHCHVCKKNIEGELTFIVHVKTHSEPRVLSCLVCKKTFIDEENLEEHMSKHYSKLNLNFFVKKDQENEDNDNEEEATKCDICFEVFESTADLDSHMNLNTQELDVVIMKSHNSTYIVKKYCDQVTVKKQSWSTDWQVAARYDIERLLCILQYADYRLLQYHPPMGESRIHDFDVCPYCGITLEKSSTQIHLQLHLCPDSIKKGQCLYCPWKGSWSSLVEHMRSTLHIFLAETHERCPYCFVIGNSIADDHFAKHQRDLPIFTDRLYCVYCDEIVKKKDMEKHMFSQTKLNIIKFIDMVNWIDPQAESNSIIVKPKSNNDKIVDEHTSTTEKTRESSTMNEELECFDFTVTPSSNRKTTTLSPNPSKKPDKMVIGKIQEPTKNQPDSDDVAHNDKTPTKNNTESSCKTSKPVEEASKKTETHVKQNRKPNIVFEFPSTKPIKNNEKAPVKCGEDLTMDAYSKTDQINDAIIKNRNAVANALMDGLDNPDCKICHWKFETFSHLKEHLIKHVSHPYARIGLDSRDAFCIFCQTIVRKASMKTHINLKHMNEKKQSCKKMSTKAVQASIGKQDKECSFGRSQFNLSTNSESERSALKQMPVGEQHKVDSYTQTKVNSSTEAVQTSVCSFDHSRCNLSTNSKSKPPDMKQSPDGKQGNVNLSNPTIVNSHTNSESKPSYFKLTVVGKQCKEGSSIQSELTWPNVPYPYTCSFCSRGFCAAHTLLKHVKSCHPWMYEVECERIKEEKKQKRRAKSIAVTNNLIKKLKLDKHVREGEGEGEIIKVCSKVKESVQSVIPSDLIICTHNLDNRKVEEEENKIADDHQSTVTLSTTTTKAIPTPLSDENQPSKPQKATETIFSETSLTNKDQPLKSKQFMKTVEDKNSCLEMEQRDGIVNPSNAHEMIQRGISPIAFEEPQVKLGTILNVADEDGKHDSQMKENVNEVKMEIVSFKSQNLPDTSKSKNIRYADFSHKMKYTDGCTYVEKKVYEECEKNVSDYQSPTEVCKPEDVDISGSESATVTEVEEETEEEIMESESDEEMLQKDCNQLQNPKHKTNFSSKYSCPHCHLSFPHYTELVTHVTVHANLNQKERHFNVPYPYICVYCGTGFYRTYGLKKHLQGKHSILYQPDLEKNDVFVNHALGLEQDYEKNNKPDERDKLSKQELPKRDRSKFKDMFLSVKTDGMREVIADDESGTRRTGGRKRSVNKDVLEFLLKEKIKRKKNTVSKSPKKINSNSKKKKIDSRESVEATSSSEEEAGDTSEEKLQSENEEEEEEEKETDEENSSSELSDTTNQKKFSVSVCRYCDLIFLNSKSLNEHTKVHSKALSTNSSDTFKF